ncbi:uncharacterized protein B0I36DRAFT_64355 [Microdochium trichocladiopsis]|uniref:Zn(2)-C6 fungal-type domain-containing protein n=1 Tax=Microdochium trichocladiopsis TaxID=1682393 RepID=A0A9P8YG46_9PEZI|nr:uncharacterized protein B0I36DRAFT_64355 [Microdochium trichocladiopsis]KAH7037313.1 hypothetical protein B0I36DRAFT_64355 [Microdochium trichocladiopsis]
MPHEEDKVKCDGEFPCKRCKDDGLVCTAGTRKKTEYKQLPKGYAEVLEHTQFALIATVHKLYAMVREGQTWDLGEPDLNDRGQPIIHNIATKLGCIRPNADIDLPPHSVFPEDEAGLSQLAAELQAQQPPEHESMIMEDIKMERSLTETRSDRASSSELDHSDFEQDYRATLLGEQQQQQHTNLQTLSPQSFSSCNDFDVNTPISAGLDPSADAMMFADFPPRSGGVPTSMPMWEMSRLSAMGDNMAQYMPNMNLNMADMMLSQGLIESEFGTIKPHMVSCPNSEAMLGIGDPMIYSGYNMEAAMRS